MVNRVKRKDPTRGLAIFFVVVILLVLAAVLYKGITGRNDYEAELRASQSAPASSAAPPVAASQGQ